MNPHLATTLSACNEELETESKETLFNERSDCETDSESISDISDSDDLNDIICAIDTEKSGQGHEIAVAEDNKPNSNYGNHRLSVDVADPRSRCVELQQQLEAVQRALVEPLQREIAKIQNTPIEDFPSPEIQELEIILKPTLSLLSNQENDHDCGLNCNSNSYGDEQYNHLSNKRLYPLIDQSLRRQTESELKSMRESLEIRSEWKAFYAYHLERFRQLHAAVVQQYHDKLEEVHQKCCDTEEELRVANRDMVQLRQVTANCTMAVVGSERAMRQAMKELKTFKNDSKEQVLKMVKQHEATKENMQSELQTVLQEVDALESDVKKYESLKKANRSTKRLNTVLNDKLCTKVKEATDLFAENLKLREHGMLLRRDVASASEKQAMLSHTIETLKKELATLEDQCKEQDNLTVINRGLKELVENSETLLRSQGNELKHMSSEMERLKEEISQLHAKQANAKKIKGDLEASLIETVECNKSLTEEMSNAHRSLEYLKTELSLLTSELQLTRECDADGIESMKAQLEEANVMIKIQEGDLEESLRLLVKISDEASSLKSDLETERTYNAEAQEKVCLQLLEALTLKGIQAEKIMEAEDPNEALEEKMARQRQEIEVLLEGLHHVTNDVFHREHSSSFLSKHADELKSFHQKSLEFERRHEALEKEVTKQRLEIKCLTEGKAQLTKEIECLTEERTQLTKEIESHRDCSSSIVSKQAVELETLAKKLAEGERQNETLEEEKIQQQQEIECLVQAKTQLTKALESHREQLSRLVIKHADELEALAGKVAEGEHRNQSLEEEKASQQREMECFVDDKVQLNKQIESLCEKSSSLIATHTDELETLAEKIIAGERQNEALKKEKASQQRDIVCLEEMKAQLTKELESHREQSSLLGCQYATELKAVNESNTILKNQLAALESSMKAEQETVAEAIEASNDEIGSLHMDNMLLSYEVAQLKAHLTSVMEENVLLSENGHHEGNGTCYESQFECNVSNSAFIIEPWSIGETNSHDGSSESYGVIDESILAASDELDLALNTYKEAPSDEVTESQPIVTAGDLERVYCENLSSLNQVSDRRPTLAAGELDQVLYECKPPLNQGSDETLLLASKTLEDTAIIQARSTGYSSAPRKMKSFASCPTFVPVSRILDSSILTNSSETSIGIAEHRLGPDLTSPVSQSFALKTLEGSNADDINTDEIDICNIDKSVKSVLSILSPDEVHDNEHKKDERLRMCRVSQTSMHLADHLLGVLKGEKGSGEAVLEVMDQLRSLVFADELKEVPRTFIGHSNFCMFEERNEEAIEVTLGDFADVDQFSPTMYINDTSVKEWIGPVASADEWIGPDASVDDASVEEWIGPDAPAGANLHTDEIVDDASRDDNPDIADELDGEDRIQLDMMIAHFCSVKEDESVACEEMINVVSPATKVGEAYVLKRSAIQNELPLISATSMANKSDAVHPPSNLDEEYSDENILHTIIEHVD